ncbi:hypothetical protein LRS73_05305 [Methylobacterium currus]|uniref:hypothetical protein n=1 Tax=Methylobacterium currus TaxID=2051553 RepID=UPI001E30BDCF|nr:hypothetical protein [Methylobacterium currus]UHC17312.1 hypothetical protein LRS73_05305 [Methylobacterium currus]
MSADLSFLARLTVAVPQDLADAVRRTAEARGLSTADYARGALQGRLLMDGASFRTLPNLERLTGRPGRDRNV